VNDPISPDDKHDETVNPPEDEQEEREAEPPAGKAHAPISTLLKHPIDFAVYVRRDEWRWSDGVALFACGVLFHAVYGFAAGTFGGMAVSLMTCMKAMLICSSSLALCLPSLYVFSCVAGLPTTLRQAFTVGASALAMTGLLLVALAPVIWLFSVSTESVGFIATLNLVIWVLSISFVRRIFGELRRRDAGGAGKGLTAWLIVYLIVSLQMATTMRPLLALSGRDLFAQEKVFFITHFLSVFQ
jgi:hypothetical protein